MVDHNRSDNGLPPVSCGVKDFYESHPYPTPVSDLNDYRRRWSDRNRCRADFHLYWPDRPYRDNLAILVAGCGTSQAAKYSLRQSSGRVVGIDVSAASIRHTEALKHGYHLDNLDLVQLPIERVGDLGEAFDKVVCTGVLHHLPDPEAGLHALRGVLKPDGVMHLMVYATYGRSGIYMLQEYCRRLGVGRSDEEIVALANTLMALPAGHPLAPLLAAVPDFRTKAGLADALLHPRDRAYTVPQFFDLIERGGLHFGRWLRQAPYLPCCGAPAGTPHAARLENLAAEEQYTAMELFRGTMMRHSAILHREAPPPIHFAGDRWEACIPIRLPETRCIVDRLPEGADAVLINPSHTDSDLALPISSEEKGIYIDIDGRRTIGELLLRSAKKRPTLTREQANHFFEKLWWYDQMVFSLVGKEP